MKKEIKKEYVTPHICLDEVKDCTLIAESVTQITTTSDDGTEELIIIDYFEW